MFRFFTMWRVQCIAYDLNTENLLRGTLLCCSVIIAFIIVNAKTESEIRNNAMTSYIMVLTTAIYLLTFETIKIKILLINVRLKKPFALVTRITASLALPKDSLVFT